VEYPKTPECDKLLAIREKSQAIGEFLEWFQGKYVIANYYPEGSDNLQPDHIDIEKILAEFFWIDLNKTEDEKRAVLEYVRCKDVDSEG